MFSIREVINLRIAMIFCKHLPPRDLNQKIDE